jgi:nuclear pore complex protein Nup62
MYVGMNVCIYVCMYLFMYVCMYACMYMYVGMHVCTYVRTYVCMYVCMYVWLCMYACKVTLTYVCMYAFTYVRMYACMHEIMLVSLVTNNNDVSDSSISIRNMINDTISEQVPWMCRMSVQQLFSKNFPLLLPYSFKTIHSHYASLFHCSCAF